jgi:hypothetical protein
MLSAGPTERAIRNNLDKAREAMTAPIVAYTSQHRTPRAKRSNGCVGSDAGSNYQRNIPGVSPMDWKAVMSDRRNHSNSSVNTAPAP